jgi:hypothetical protein
MGRGSLRRLALERELGEVEAVHRPRLAPVLWFAACASAPLAATALWLRFVAPDDTGPGRVVWPLVGVAVAGVCLLLAATSALDQGRRIAVCRGGLLHLRRARVEAVPWDAVRHLRRRWRRSYEIETAGAARVTWNEDLQGHDELFQAIERRVTPLLLAAARERLTAGDHVAFDGLVVTAAGLTAEGRAAPLPWGEVASVTYSSLGEPRIRRRGESGTWFAGAVPDQAVFRTLMEELFADHR